MNGFHVESSVNGGSGCNTHGLAICFYGSARSGIAL